MEQAVEVKKVSKKITNKIFSETDSQFLDCCKKANVNPTTRQASKFRAGRGRASKQK